MPLTTATLSGPTTGVCSVVSSNFTVTLDAVAPGGGVSVAITSTVGGDTILSTPLVIAAGNISGTFTLTPLSIGNRDISIATTPSLTIAGSPITYASTGKCPDDTAVVSRTKVWPGAIVTCYPAFNLSYTATIDSVAEQDLYCTTTPITLTITE